MKENKIVMPVESYATRVEGSDGVVRYFGAMGPCEARAREAKIGEYAREAKGLGDEFNNMMRSGTDYSLPWNENPARAQEIGRMTRERYGME